MTDKEYNKQKKRIQLLHKKWHDTLGLSWWRVTYAYSREGIGKHEAAYESESAGMIGAMCETDSNYLTATITFYLPNLAEISDDILEEIFLHECMHILINPMSHKDKSAEEERVATMLARALAWAYGDAFKSGQKAKVTKKKKK